MSPPKSLDAYRDCESHFERAIASPRGIAVSVSESGMATKLVMRLNYFRDRIRKRNKAVYPADHPLHGMSPYDGLQVTKDPDNPLRIFLRPYSIATTGVEEL